jgi:hypothetical protein
MIVSDVFCFFSHFFRCLCVVVLCENRCEKKTRDQKREKTEKKEDRKKRQKIASLEASEKNESKKRLTSPYIYTHTSLRTESVHNREGTLSLSLSFTALFPYIS